jgi:tryptophan 2,3-dioxygenase
MSSETSKTKSAEKLGCPMGYGQPAPTDATSALSYNNYLQVDKLKELQVCQSSPAHHDEPLFIIIHQTYELWFKEILHEIDQVASLLKANEPRKAIFYLKRINAILKVLVSQIHILETMSPKDFLGFRNNLNPASGFQSSQFREIEFAGGLKDQTILEHFVLDKHAYAHLKQRFEAPSLADLFWQLLAKYDLGLGDSLLARFSSVLPNYDSEDSGDRLRQRLALLLPIYNDPDNFSALYDLSEALVDFDEQLHLWRANHVLVVERIIGFKPGTGGSQGVAYLQTTLAKRLFPELWKVRTLLQ